MTAEDNFSKNQALDSEDWSKTTDIILRRRIQNRLAQRLRRKRLREGKASHITLLEPSKEGPLTSTQNPLPTTRSRELISDRPETLKASQPTPFLTPSKSDNPLFNASDRVPNLPEVSMSEGETATILSRLNQTLAELQEHVSAKPSESQLSTSKPSLDSAHWNSYMMSAFDTNNPGIWSNSFGFTHDSTDNAVSTASRSMTASPWLATPKQQNLPKSPLSIKSPSIRSPSYNSNGKTNAMSCTRGNTALHLAAQQGHVGTVSILLRTGADIDACNGDGLSALHIAVSNNHINVARLLLTHGASSSLRTKAGLSILHLAVRHGTLPLVLLVLKYVTVPGDLDLRDPDGRSAFHLAVVRGDEEIVRSLLEKGANSMAKIGDQTPVEQRSAMAF